MERGGVTGFTTVVIRSTFGKNVERRDFKTKEECDKYLANPHHSKSEQSQIIGTFLVFLGVVKTTESNLR